MIGYKAFENDLTCRGFQYEIGKEYSIKEEPIICARGFHFCKNLKDVYKYYPMIDTTRVCKVEAWGKITTNDGKKFCTSNIMILEEIKIDSLKKGNIGNNCTGYINIGDRNSGDYNIGYQNSGDYNNGTGNSGDFNYGDFNTGNGNIGNRNSGFHNNGINNSGDCNIGHSNTGSSNNGDNNTGSYNIGDWNTSSYNHGCFNTQSQHIKMFNKETDWGMEDWYRSKARRILSKLTFCNGYNTRHIPIERMTEEEIAEHPECAVTEGFLKETETNLLIQKAWDNLADFEKQEIYNLPNFDKDIFKECTGIDIGGGKDMT